MRLRTSTDVEKDARIGQPPEWLGRVAGADGFARYLRAIGRDASVVPLPDRGATPHQDAPVSSTRDRHLVLIARSPIHLVSLRTSPTPKRGKLSLHHHFVVRADGLAGSLRDREANEERFDARLGQSFKGLLRKSRTRLTFVGGELADRLRGDDAVRDALFRHLGTTDDLVVAPDLTRGLIRIVHMHPMSARRPLWAPHPTTFYERMLPEPLFAAIERIARHVRTLATARTHAPSWQNPPLSSTA